MKIGNVSMTRPAPRSDTQFRALTPLLSLYEKLMPRANTAAGQAVLRHLQWMMQKDLLGQDMLLYGTPGHYRRRLAQYYCSIVGKELEQLIITPDTCESDLKERREVVDGSIRYTMQAPLRAAVFGRMLLLVDVHKAERNVLPTLNNLLENREMNLPSGRRLVHPAKKHRDDDPLSPSFVVEGPCAVTTGILQCSADFRVCALGSPVPTFPGFTLDPPFRSRFQCRVVEMTYSGELASALDLLSNEVAKEFREKRQEWDRFAEELHLHVVPMLPLPPAVPSLASGCHASAPVAEGAAPRIPFCPPEALTALPLALLAATSSIPEEGRSSIRQRLAQRVFPASSIGSIPQLGLNEKEALLLHQLGAGSASQIFDSFEDVVVGIQTLQKRSVCSQTGAALGAVCCIIGPRCSGKSVAVQAALKALGGSRGERFHIVNVYKELSSTDLLQRRTLDANGNSGWSSSPLVLAAVEGVPAVLDGVHRVNGILSALAPLIHDHWLQLPSGMQLVPQQHFDALVEVEMKAADANREQAAERLNAVRNIWPVRKGFFVVALAEPSSVEMPWLDTETIALFRVFFQLQATSLDRLLAPVAAPAASLQLAKLLEPTRLAIEGMQELMGRRISPRSVQYLVGYAQLLCTLSCDASGDSFGGTLLPEMREAISRTLLVPFHGSRAACEELLEKLFPTKKDSLPSSDAAIGPVVVGDDWFRVGRAVGKRRQVESVDPSLLSFVSYFVEIPSQLKILERIVAEMSLQSAKQQHFLLIGNQGTGKNKLCDQLLAYMNAEREYMQLNRDSTLQSLCVAPSVVAGRMVWEASPLLRAMELGRVAVLDEADKAPLEAVAVLKALLSDEVLSLPDGRVARRRHADEPTDASNPKVLYIHPNFRCFVLANRPGFPFLGNDFYRECGDIFSCHIVENPDMRSEMALVTAYAPLVPRPTLQKLCAAFSALRQRADRGELAYPFSTRELVSVAKHLNAFPKEPVASALRNVTDFDSFSPHVFELVRQQLLMSGLVLDSAAGVAALAAEEPLRDTHGDDDYRLDAIRKAAESFRFPSEDRQPLDSCLPRINARDVSNEVTHDVRPSSLIKFQHPRSYGSFTELRFEGQLAAFNGSRTSASHSIGSSTPPPVSPTRHVKHMARVTTHDVGEEVVVLCCAKPNTVFVVPAASLVSEADGEPANTALAVPIREIDVTFVNGAVSAMFVGPSLTAGAAAASVIIVSLEAKACWLFFPATSPRNSRLYRYELPLAVYTGVGVAGAGAVYVPQTLGNRFLEADQYLRLRTWGGCGTSEALIVNTKTSVAARVVFTPIRGDAPPCAVVVDMRALPPQNVLDDFVAVSDASHGELHTWAAVNPRTLAAQYWPFSAHTGEVSPQTEKNLDRPKNISVADLRLKAKLSAANKVAATNENTAPSSLQPNFLSAVMSPQFAAFILGDPSAVCVVERSHCENLIRIFSWSDHQTLGFNLLHFNTALGKRDVVASVTAEHASNSSVEETIAVFDLVAKTVRRLPRQEVVQARGFVATSAVVAAVASHGQYLSELLTASADGVIEVWQLDSEALGASHAAWAGQQGSGAKDPDDGRLLDITVRFTSDEPSFETAGDFDDSAGFLQVQSESGATETQVDTQGQAGGQNGGRGGSGPGGGGGGSGQNSGGNLQSIGKGGYAFDKDGRVSDFRVQRRRQLSNQMALQEPTGDVQYDQLLATVQADVRRVIAVLEAAEASDKERQWLGGRMHGELDDRRLVESVVGEQNVFKRRQVPPVQLGLPQRKPKYIDLVVDVSASMARFNAWDQRLDRLAASMVLLMEAVRCFPAKFILDIHGHSGSAVRLPFLASHTPVAGVPRTVVDTKDRASVVDRARSHARSCVSGDGTVEAMRLALANAAEVDADEKFVILVSDANLGGYGVTPKELSAMLAQYQPTVAASFSVSHRRAVSTSLVFLAEPEATRWFIRELPPGVGHQCGATSDLPTVLRNIILASLAT